ncbi:MAG: glycosyltransferase family 2 protein [Cyclobacteriaceae bacterium]
MICPAYNESENLPRLIEAVAAALDQYNYEIIIVDDGSSDDTLMVLEGLVEKYSCLRHLSFTRNFGHQNALMAGLRSAKGECVVMLDADMQHPPSLIIDMLAKWRSGFKVVQGLRQEKSSGLKALTSKWFYGLVSIMSDVPITLGTSDFRLLDRTIVDHINTLDRPVFLRGYIPWLGYETCFLSYTSNARYKGKAKYSFGKMIKLSSEGITIQSTFPLGLSRFMGAIVSVLAFFTCCLPFIFIFSRMQQYLAGRVFR